LIVEVDVEDLAVAAPVPAKIQNDSFVRCASLGERGLYLRFRDRRIRIDVLELRQRCLRQEGESHTQYSRPLDYLDGSVEPLVLLHACLLPLTIPDATKGLSMMQDFWIRYEKRRSSLAAP
jgi:hypothetical protein